MADPISPFTPTMQSEIEQLLQSQIDRSNSQTPIHQAAMAMAQRMAPGYAQSAGGGGGGSTAMPTSPLGLPSSGSSGGPGTASTVTLAALAALLKNPQFMAAIKSLMGPGAATGIPPGAPGAPATTANPTGFPTVPIAGSPSAGLGATYPGYFTNPDGSTVGIPGDPTNSGRYGGGLFPVGSSDVDNPHQPHD